MSRVSPNDLASVLRAFGMPALRAGIIRTTLEHGTVTAQDLMEALEVGRTTLVPHTQALVDSGILVQEKDPTKVGAKAGFNRLVWRVDKQALCRDLDVLRAALLSER